jgi:LL-diaminopimelate aminotransferase
MNEHYRAAATSSSTRCRTPACEVTPPKGTIYVWAPVPDGYRTAAEYCEHVLDETGVVVSPGGAYGPNGEGFFRISLTTPDDRLSEAMERIRHLRARS